MSDELYHAAIMQHARAPHRAGTLNPHDRRATADNPLCGDRVTVDLRLTDGRVADMAQAVRGCALCQASASMLAEAAIGSDPAEIAAARDTIKAMLRTDGEPPAAPFAAFAAFIPARAARSRHDCVLLPFQALERALADRG